MRKNWWKILKNLPGVGWRWWRVDFFFICKEKYPISFIRKLTPLTHLSHCFSTQTDPIYFFAIIFCNPWKKIGFSQIPSSRFPSFSFMLFFFRGMKGENVYEKLKIYIIFILSLYAFFSRVVLYPIVKNCK